MKRREFIAFAGCAAVAWPLAVGAQQPERTRRVGVLSGYDARDPEGQARLAAFRQGLHALGWTDGSNLQIVHSRFTGDSDRIRAAAAELVGLTPDVILAYAPPAVSALRRETRSIPIVFVQVTNPVGAGFVASMARPGGNITGFTSFEWTIGGKWLAALKEIAPHITRSAVILNPDNPAAGGFLGAIEAMAPSLRIQVVPIALRDSTDQERAAMERTVEAFAREPNGAMIVLPDTATITLRHPIVTLAAQHRLPAVYPFRFFATTGGLMSYGVDHVDQSRRAAAYVDRILKGKKPADLPVQAPSRFELVVNLKTAKALGISIPQAILLRADEAIE